MDVQEILSQLERNEGHFPHLAIQEAIARREEMIPPLLRVLEEVARESQPFATDGSRWIHIYAMYLLAQFRESRAYPLLVEIFAAPGELPFELVGDVVTEDLSRILASVSEGEPGGMTSLVENEPANEYVRSAAMEGLLTLVACGRRSRDEVMDYFSGLFRRLERTPSVVWGGLASACADLCPEEVQEDLRQAYEEGLIDPRFIAWDDIEEALAMGSEAALERLRRRYTLIRNVEEEIRWWACFHPDESTREEGEAHLARVPEHLDVAATFRRAQPKVGRNNSCPCGSGKKFKKCCER